MQPLIEHRRPFAGFDTRVLELEGVAELLLGFPAPLRRAA
jgi:hypothetical protein